MNILNVFSTASGQKINVLKSGVIFGKFVPPAVKVQLCSSLHMREWDNPGKYLGIPAQWGKSKTATLTWLKDLILNKMQGWKEQFLNPAGKEILLKAVIQALPTYAMTVLKFPKKFCEQICSKIARFWWARSGKDHGIHWKRWECLTKSKRDGGLGFRDFNHMNLALLAKQAWRVIKQPGLLWVRILKSIYFPNHNFLQAKKKRGASWIWASILQGRDFLIRNGQWVVGDGKTIRIWKDKWLPSHQLIPDPTDAREDTVSSLIDPINHSWDYDKLKTSLPTQAAIQACQIPISYTGAADRFLWPHTKDANYSVKTGYHAAHR